MAKTWLTIIGLEIHAELKTASKMFCHCPADHFGRPANSQTCPVCLGLPGALPFANRQAIAWTIKTGLALDCQVNTVAKFDRKNYFYPDLPKGYQISQYDQPFCQHGQLDGIRLRRVHLEEDTAKMVHQPGQTLVDFNRAGVPLMEIVTEPDSRNGQQAKAFLKHLQQIIRHLKVSDCDMEKGSMRLEVNISLSRNPVNQLRVTSDELPKYKVEIKNLNSFRFVERAINYEITRQTALLRSGRQPRQETRGWDTKKQQTYSQRSKEEAHDYRYFPEPDLPPLKISRRQINLIKKQLPELPAGQQQRFQQQGLTEYQARVLVSHPQKAQYFEKVMLTIKNKIKINLAANLIINNKINFQKTSPRQLVAQITQKQPPPLGASRLQLIIKQILDKHPKAAADYRQGKAGAIKFLVGQVMSQSRGRANPDQTRQAIKSLLDK